MAKLVIESEDGGRREVELTTRTLRIGRAADSDLPLPDSNKGVSRVHAELRYENGRYVILDLNSQNGTWLDGNRVQRADLASGSELAIGPYLLRLEGEDIRPPQPEMIPEARVIESEPDPPVASSLAAAESDLAVAESDLAVAKSGDAAVKPVDAPAKSNIAPVAPVESAVVPVEFDLAPIQAAMPSAKDDLSPDVALVQSELKAELAPVKAEDPPAKPDLASYESEIESVKPDLPPVKPVPPQVTPPAAAKAPAATSTAKTVDTSAESDTQPASQPAPKFRKPEEPPLRIEELPLRLEDPQLAAEETISLPIKPAAAAAPRAHKPISAASPAREEAAPKRPVRPPTLAQPPREESSSGSGLWKALVAVLLVAVGVGAYFERDLIFPSGPASTSGAPAPETNAQIIERHLNEAKALVDKKEYEAAIRDHLDRILAIDSNHVDATLLKVRAQDALQAAASEAAANPPATPDAAPSTTAAPATASAPATSPSAAAAPAPAPKPGAAGPATTPERAANPARAAAVDPSRGGGSGTDNLPSPRKPNETVQAWRTRNAELQKQYNTAKNAFDRRQYAAAVSGFEAVIKGEPNFLDAPQLLAKARGEIKVTGPEALAAANKADVAGNWTLAVEQFDRARKLDSSLAPQADEGIRRVREKMRTGGAEAFKRARQLDALGRAADAIKEYENAAQWLAADDPNRTIARQRADQLKAGQK